MLYLLADCIGQDLKNSLSEVVWSQSKSTDFQKLEGVFHGALCQAQFSMATRMQFLIVFSKAIAKPVIFSSLVIFVNML